MSYDNEPRELTEVEQKHINALKSYEFLDFLRDRESPVANYVAAGTQIVKNVERVFASFDLPMPYDTEYLTFTLQMPDDRLYGKVTLSRTKFGQKMRYDTLVEDACFKKASITVGHIGSLKSYFGMLRNRNGAWSTSLQDSKRLYRLDTEHKILTNKELVTVLKALYHLEPSDKIQFNAKYPTDATITL